MRIVITKKYGEQVLFDKQEFVFEEGKITCLLGESGAGKTTLLRALAGIEPFEGETNAPASISLAFQEARLLPFASALDNLTFVGIETEKAAEWLSWAEIKDVRQKASTLSGGEKQRVSLARALAKKSDLLLLDEPFSSVDAARKVRLLERLRETLSSQNRTTVFITHDIDEALYIADTVLLLQGGVQTAFPVQEKDRAEYGNSSLRRKIYQMILKKE